MSSELRMKNGERENLFSFFHSLKSREPSGRRNGEETQRYQLPQQEKARRSRVDEKFITL
jgi:hypothetical protein